MVPAINHISKHFVKHADFFYFQILMIFMMMMTFSDKDFCTISAVMLLSGRTICTFRLLRQSVYSDTKYKN